MTTRLPQALRRATETLQGVPFRTPRVALRPSVWAARHRGYSALLVVVLSAAALAGSVWIFGARGFALLFFVPFELIYMLALRDTECPTGIGLLDLSVLRHGELVEGRVVSMLPSTDSGWGDARLYRVKVHFRVQGRLYRRALVLKAGRALRGYRVGSPVAVLYKRRKPARNVVPGLLGITFECKEVEDHRPEVLEGVHRITTVGAAALEGEAFEAALRTPFEGSTARRWSWRRRSEVIGALSLEGHQLIQTMPGSGLKAVVDLLKPFVVQTSAWILPGDEARLHVTIRPRGQLGADFIEFDVVVPQSCVSRAMPLKEDYLPRLERRDFVRLWPLVEACALSHGEERSGQLAAHQLAQMG